MVQQQQQNERLGPAERIIQTLLAYADHMVHNRPGIVSRDVASPTGVHWEPVTHKVEDGQKVVYKITTTKSGRKTRIQHHRVGVMGDDGIVRNGAVIHGRYQPAGLFPEVAAWIYRQIAEVWKLDNEFAAKWASYAYGQDHKDLKVALAAFMLCQSRKGDPVTEAGKVLFRDADYRDVGEAMCLLTGDKALSPKLLLRVYEFLRLPVIAAINRELGFAISAKNPFFGRWHKTMTRWLTFREDNPAMLAGAVKAGYRQTLIELVADVVHAGGGYKPGPAFYEALRWKQSQAKTGHREVNIGKAVKAAETWKDLTEEQVCERITTTRPSWKRIVSLTPITRAVMSAAIEAGCLSDKDLVILTPTIEELGLLTDATVKARWERALKAAEDMRATNIARNVQSKETKEKLEEAGVAATKKAAEEVTKNIRVYVLVDASGSMEGAIDAAKGYIAKFLPAFPLDRLHVASFNTTGIERPIRHASAAGVENAFKGVTAGGGTDYGAGVHCLFSKYRPQDDEDVLVIFFGDEDAMSFAAAFRRVRATPMAFGFVKVMGRLSRPNQAVRQTAAELGIPCFMIDEKTFDDPYAIPRTIRALVAATPVGAGAQAAAPRVTLVDTILKTELLRKPVWALPDPTAPARKKAAAPAPTEMRL